MGDDGLVDVLGLGNRPEVGVGAEIEDFAGIDRFVADTGASGALQG